MRFGAFGTIVACVLLTVGSLVPAAGSPQPAAGGRTGTLYFLRDGPSDSTLSTLDQSTGAPTVVLDPSGVLGITVGLTESGDPDLLYGSRPGELLDIPTNGSPSTPSGVTTIIEGLAWSPTNATLYAAYNSQLVDGFFTVDPTTGTRGATLASPGTRIEGIAWRGTDDRIYGLARNENLYAYTPSTDTWALVGATGMPDGDRAGLAWNPITDRLFGIGADGILYSIDPATGAATLVGDTGLGRGGGLAFVEDAMPTSTQATQCGTVQVATAAGGITNLSAVPVPASPALPAGVGSFPCGLVRFDVVGLMAGDSTTITVTLPAGANADSYWKLQHGAWSRVTGAQISSTSPRTITFTLTDGGPFDADGTANGTIVDPGGPAVAAVVTPVVVTPRFAG